MAAMSVDEQHWTGLRQWLLTKIMPFTFDRNVITIPYEPIVDGGKDIFMKAFTHETYDSMNNYETLEMVGDRLQKGMIALFMFKKYPHYSPSELSELVSYYESDEIQAPLMKRIGADAHIRTGKGLGHQSDIILGDVFESLICAVYLAFERLYPNLGFSAGYGLFTAFYIDIKIDENFAKGDYITRVDQMFSKFNSIKGANLEVREFPSEESFTIQVSLKESQRTLIQKYFGQDPGPLTQEATAIDKKAAKRLAYKKMYEKLITIRDRAGNYLTTERMTDLKRKEDIDIPSVALNVPQAMLRLRSAGYDEMYFEVSQKMSKDSNIKVIMLTGRNRQTGKTIRLMSGRGPLDTVRTKAFLMKLYAEGKPPEFVDITVGHYHKLALEKARASGYTDIVIREAEGYNNTNKKVLQLLGTKPDGTTRTLSTVMGMRGRNEQETRHRDDEIIWYLYRIYATGEVPNNHLDITAGPR